MEWFTAVGNGPFAVAILIMFGLTAVEMVALFTGFSVNDMVDEFVVSHSGLGAADGAHSGMEATHAEAQGVFGRFLSWLYVGHVPVLMVLIVLLTVFGVIGMVGQGVLRSTLGFAAPAVLAAPAALFLSLPLVRAVNGGLARIMPRDETSAVSPESFIGRTAVIAGGAARRGLPAQARLVDQFGTTHYLMVEPDDADEVLPDGEVVLVVKQIGGARFAVIRNPNAALVDR